MQTLKSTGSIYFRMYRSEIRSILKLSIPIVIGQLGIIMMGVIDVMMVRDLGVIATAATGATNNVFFLTTMFGLGALTIIAPLIATAYQQGKISECRQLLRSGLLLAFIIGMVTMGLLWGLIENFEWLRQDRRVAQEAVKFLEMLTLSVLPMLVFVGAKHFTDGLSLTKVAMTVTWIGLVINVVLNQLFIFGLSGHIAQLPTFLIFLKPFLQGAAYVAQQLEVPEMGLQGAGLATLLSRTIMALSMLAYILFNKKTRYIVSSPSGGGSIFKKMKFIASLGIPVGVTYFLEAGAFGLAGLLVGTLSPFDQAAHQVAMTLASVTYMMTTGIAAAGAIRVGQGVGASKPAHILRSGTSAIILGVTIMSVFCIAFLSVGQYLVLPFIEDPKAMEMSISLLVIAGFFQIFDGTQAVALGILRGVSDVKIPTIIAFFAYWGVAIPLGCILAFVFNMGAHGIWVGLLLGLMASAILLTWRFYKIVSIKYPISSKKVKLSIKN